MPKDTVPRTAIVHREERKGSLVDSWQKYHFLGTGSLRSCVMSWLLPWQGLWRYPQFSRRQVFYEALGLSGIRTTRGYQILLVTLIAEKSACLKKTTKLTRSTYSVTPSAFEPVGNQELSIKVIIVLLAAYSTPIR